MLYVKIDANGLPLDIRRISEMQDVDFRNKEWQSRWDWKSFEEVSRIALYVTAMTGKTYLPSDHTEHVFPRFDIFEAPRIGDEVSRGFNGDYYPEGVIVKITKGWRVTTSTGRRFNRCKTTGGWREIGRGFYMVSGHINERNPHF